MSFKSIGIRVDAIVHLGKFRLIEPIGKPKGVINNE